MAVSTLASADLAGRLYELNPPGLCLAGKTETENIGLEKAILNALANPALRCLVLAGGWVTLLDHAAYLGKELARAELSLQTGAKYSQDGA